MAEGSDRRGQAAQPVRGAEEAWLADVARDASQVAGGVPVELLGDYLSLLAEAATTGRKPQPRELDAVGLLGRRAAELGVPAGNAVQLYLSAAWRLWRELPMVVRSKDSETVRAAAEAVLRVVDRAVGSLAEGYTAARRE
ncbi:MAG: PucR family transcriptional regulator, partial [Pseudonocardiaceae bacterium]